MTLTPKPTADDPNNDYFSFPAGSNRDHPREVAESINHHQLGIAARTAILDWFNRLTSALIGNLPINIIRKDIKKLPAVAAYLADPYNPEYAKFLVAKWIAAGIADYINSKE